MSAATQKSFYLSDVIDLVYDVMDGDEDLMRYHAEHGTPSLLILTQFNQECAAETVKVMADDIRDKRVIEIGAGIGFLAIEMAKIAKSVFAIEVDPAWSWTFTHSLYRHKPKNLTWVFGTAESVADWLNGDVAVICTRSGVEQMRDIAYRMAPKVLMPLLDEVMYSSKSQRPEPGSWSQKQDGGG